MNVVVRMDWSVDQLSSIRLKGDLPSGCLGPLLDLVIPLSGPLIMGGIILFYFYFILSSVVLP